MDRNLEIIKSFVELNCDVQTILKYYQTCNEFRQFINKTNSIMLGKYGENLGEFIGKANLSKPNNQLTLYIIFVQTLMKYNIQFEKNDFYIENAQKYSEVIPDWLPDSASDWVEDNILNKVPESMTKAERKKWIKEQVEAIYPCEKRHPSWVQGTEDWPQDKDGNNLTFIKQKTDGDQETYIFKDPKTNETVNLVEYY